MAVTNSKLDIDFDQYDTDAITETDRAHFLHPWQIFDAIAEEGALPIAAAEGAYIYDSDGTRYLDAVGGLWCTNIGMGREEMADAIADQVRQNGLCQSLCGYDQYSRCNPFGSKLARAGTRAISTMWPCPAAALRR